MAATTLEQDTALVDDLAARIIIEQVAVALSAADPPYPPAAIEAAQAALRLTTPLTAAQKTRAVKRAVKIAADRRSGADTRIDAVGTNVDMTPGEARVLGLMIALGTANFGTIAEVLDITRQAVSDAVRRLEEHGYLSRAVQHIDIAPLRLRRRGGGGHR